MAGIRSKWDIDVLTETIEVSQNRAVNQTRAICGPTRLKGVLIANAGQSAADETVSHIREIAEKSIKFQITTSPQFISCVRFTDQCEDLKELG